MRRLPPLNALRAFEAVARLGSVAAAAEELHVTAGAVSKQIRTLEEALGDTLFERGSQGLEPTLEGRALAAAAYDAFDRIAEATHTFRPAAGDVVRVTTIASFAAQWLIPRVARFEAAHDARLCVRTATRLENLESPALDLALRFGRGDWAGVDAVPLGPARNVVVASPELAQRTGPARTPGDFAEATLLADAHVDHWSEVFAAFGDAPRPSDDRYLFQDYNVLVEAALHGRGVAALPELIVAEDVNAGRLVALLGGPTPSAWGYFVATASTRRRRRTVEAAIAWLLEEGRATRIVNEAAAEPQGGQPHHAG